MKAIIVGMGSMGRRRMRILLSLNVDIIAVDTNEQRLSDIRTQVFAVCRSIKEALAFSPDIAFVCTSPLSHFSIQKELLLAGIHTFTELNLVDQGYSELINLSEKNGLVAFPSSTWIYRKEMQYMISAVNKHSGCCAYRYHIGQYLPDWHPWESYKDYFIGDKKTNACREILALELPWLIKAFGPILSVSSVPRRLTTLDINYPDMYMIQLIHENGHVGSLLVDVASPIAIRTIEIIGEKLQIFWNGKPETLQNYDSATGCMILVPTYELVSHQEGYAANIIENAYVDEVKAFLSAVDGQSDTILYTLSEDKHTLEWIDKIERGN